MEEQIKLKKELGGTLNGLWVPQATRDAVVPFIRHGSSRTGLAVALLVGWLGIAASVSSRWSQRLGTPNQHNAPIRATSGSRTGKSPPSSPSTTVIPWKAIGGWRT